MSTKEFYAIFKANGFEDTVDPVTSFEEDDNYVWADNGAYEYKYRKADLSAWGLRTKEAKL